MMKYDKTRSESLNTLTRTPKFAYHFMQSKNYCLFMLKQINLHIFKTNNEAWKSKTSTIRINCL